MAAETGTPLGGVPRFQHEQTAHWRRGAISLGNSLRLAILTLWAHKLRSGLTLFGIIVGISAVSLIGATLGAIRDIAAKNTAQTIGANAFIIARTASVGNRSRKELAEKMRRNPEIYRREAEALAERTGKWTHVAPGLATVADVKAGSQTFLGAAITGASPDIQQIRNVELSSGRFFTRTENRRAVAVAVIGQDLADELFPSLDPIGKSVRIQGREFRIIGIQKKQGASFGASLDRVVYMPLPAFEKIWGSRRSVTVYLQPQDPAQMEETLEFARMSLRLMRRLRPLEPDNFDILVPEASRDFLLRVIGIIGIAIIPISSVALIVAGIVVMNMMLVSVTERTREIGIRKSLGARNRDIFTEILLESSVLTLFGGAAGLGISYLGAIALSGILGAPAIIPVSYILAALGISALIGCGAGFFPAWVAAHMTPVEALRYET